MRCHVNQVAADCRNVLLSLPREYGVQFDADCRAVLLLPREYFLDGRGGYAKVDLNPSAMAVIGMLVLPLNRGEVFAISRYRCYWCCCSPCMLGKYVGFAPHLQCCDRTATLGCPSFHGTLFAALDTSVLQL